MLIGEVVKGRPRDSFQVSVKCGALRDRAGRWSGFDARPRAVKNFLAYFLQRLGLNDIDIYRPRGSTRRCTDPTGRAPPRWRAVSMEATI